MKKNLVKKAVLPALAALVCSVIALTSVSYAWFSMGNEASVDGVEMNVTTAGGLQVSASGDASDFKPKLSLDDLKADSLVGEGKNQFPDKVVPVSTGGAVDNGKLTFYSGKIEDGALVVDSEASKSYIVFDFYVKVNVANKLNLLGTSEVKCTTSGKQTHLASRVAFVNLGYAATAAGAQDMVTGFTASNAIKIWEPNSATRSTAYTNAGGQLTGKQDYDGIVSASGSASKVTTFDVASDAKQELCDLNVGYNRIRVYIWLEGQDIDCLNELSGGSLLINLKFSQNELNS